MWVLIPANLTCTGITRLSSIEFESISRQLCVRLPADLFTGELYDLFTDELSGE